MSNQFYLWGEEPSTAIDIDVDVQENLDGFRHTVAGQFAIVEPSGEFCRVLLLLFHSLTFLPQASTSSSRAVTHWPALQKY